MFRVSAVRRRLSRLEHRAARFIRPARAPAIAAVIALAASAWVLDAAGTRARAQTTGAQATGTETEAADARSYAVPVITIFPGDVIAEHMIDAREFSQLRPTRGGYVTSTDSLVGKIARRTLMPGFAIPHNAVENAKLVQKGVPTQLVFEDGPLTITTLVSPLQAGELNESIRARNLDSGLVVYGVVQENGTLRATGG